MTQTGCSLLAAIPSVDRMLRDARLEPLILAHGRGLVADALREETSALRELARSPNADAFPARPEAALAAAVQERVARLLAVSLRPVFNLTGTVLHTNLGRAPLPAEAIDAVARIAASASNLEFDLERGRRGDRDAHTEAWLCRLTGAEAATVVNNNAAAILLLLNALAARKRVAVSRGELIEIGGSFRLPDIMGRAGCRLVEVGTTNRTHLADYAAVIDSRMALLMKVHTSNFEIRGFTASVETAELARLAHQHGLALASDLGSGTLVDMSHYGLPREPTPADALGSGADLVTFSGDKLLGGPQCGIVVGRGDLIARLKRNPLKRAMRVDKMTIAALEAVLRLYADPGRLPERLPALRLLTRPSAQIEALAERVSVPLRARVSALATVEVIPCRSQVGSGALPVDQLASAGLAIRPLAGRGRGRALERIARACRELPVPVLGRIDDGTLIFDLRCLDDEQGFVAQLDALRP